MHMTARLLRMRTRSLVEECNRCACLARIAAHFLALHCSSCSVLGRPQSSRTVLRAVLCSEKHPITPIKIHQLTTADSVTSTRNIYSWEPIYPSVSSLLLQGCRTPRPSSIRSDRPDSSVCCCCYRSSCRRLISIRRR